MSMTLSEIEKEIPVWYTASNEPGGPAIHLESDAGRGKTTTMEKFPQIMKEIDPEGNYGFSYINGLTITLPFLCGFMQMNVHETMKRQITNFSLPAWWFTDEGKPLEAYDGGLVFIDEEDKMGVEERKLTRDMKLKHRIGVHTLPPGWVVWSAGNPLGSRNGGTKTFDFIINSQLLITVRDSSEDWVNWAKRNKVLPEIISFGEDNSHVLFQKAPDKQGPYCTPRSLAQTDTFLRAKMSVYSKSKIPLDEITQTTVAGGIGKEAAEALFLHIRLAQELPSYRECIANPQTVPIPAEPDRLRLFAYKLADWAQPTHSVELGTLMSRLPSEFQFMMVKMIRDRNARVLIMPEFRQWCKSNAQLIAIIEGYERQHGHNDPMLSAVAQVA
jgi:hypothetical protein